MINNIKKLFTYIWGPGVILVVVFLFFRPILIGSKIFAGGDLLTYFYPVYNFYSNSIASFNFYTDGILSGLPIYVSFVGGFFSVINIFAFKTFFFITAYHLVTVFNFALAGIFTYWLARNLKISKIGSVISSLGFILSFFLLTYGAILPISNIYWLLPLVFLCLLKISQKKYWYLIFACLSAGLAFLSGNVQFILFIFVAALFWAIFLDWQNYDYKKKYYANFPVVKSLVVIGLLGLLFGSFQIFPSYIYSEHVGRTESVDIWENSLSITDISSYIIPNFQIPHFDWGRSGMLYFGFLPLFFALISLIYLKSKQVRFMKFLWLFALIVAVPYSPIFWLLSKLPGFNLFRGPVRWSLLAVFAAAILAGYGYDAFMKKPEQVKKLLKIAKYLVIILTSLAIISSIVFSVYSNVFFEKAATYYEQNIFNSSQILPLEHYQQLIKQYIATLFSNLSITNEPALMSIIFMVLSMGLLLYIGRTKNTKPRMGLIILLLVVSNLLVVGQGFYKYIDKNVYLEEPATVKLIKQRESDLDSFRVYSFLPGFVEFTKRISAYQISEEDIALLNAALLTPNHNLLYDLDSADGYDNIMAKRYARVIAEIGSEQATVGNKLANKEISLKAKTEELASKQNILNMLNVKYILAGFELDSDKFDLVEKVGVGEHELPVYVYENKQVQERIYFASKVQFFTDEEAVFDLLNISDFSQLTLIEAREPKQTQEINQASISNVDWQPGKVVFTAKTDVGGWVVVSQSYLPGWEAKIDGYPTNIYPANYINQAVYVPAGEHKISLEFIGLTNYRECDKCL